LANILFRQLHLQKLVEYTSWPILQGVYKIWTPGKKHVKSGTILLVHLTVPTRFVFLWIEPSSFT